MKRLLPITVLALTVLGSACAGQQPTATPTALSPGVIPPGTSITLPAPESDEPTVENPMLHLVIDVVDAETEEPVSADVAIDDHPPERDVTHLEVVVSATEPHTVTATADRYQKGQIVITPHVQHHERLELPIRLRRALGEAAKLELFVPGTRRARGLGAPPAYTQGPKLVEGESPPTPSGPAWWSWPCNIPPGQYPDGCPEFASIARPDQPIPPPCIRTAYTETVALDDFPDTPTTRLVIVLDHPEIPDYAYPDPWSTQEVHVDLWPDDGRWRTWWGEGKNWDFDCASNPAPLAWTAAEVLDTGSLTPTELAYDAPLPGQFLDLLADLGGASYHRVYLPVLTRNN